MKSAKKSVGRMAAAAVLSASMAFASVAGAVSPSEAVNDNRMLRDISMYQLAGATSLHPAENIIREASENMLTVLKDKQDELKKNPEKIYDLLEDNILMHFDFRAMSRLVLAKHWRKATPDQRDRFTEEFKTLLVRTYASAMLNFTDEKINYLPMRKSSKPNRTRVQIEIEQKGGPAIALDYDMYLNKQKEWKIYNLSIEGISLVSNYRSSFGSEIRSKGLEKLIETLHEKNESSKLKAPASHFQMKPSLM